MLAELDLLICCDPGAPQVSRRAALIALRTCEKLGASIYCEATFKGEEHPFYACVKTTIADQNPFEWAGRESPSGRKRIVLIAAKVGDEKADEIPENVSAVYVENEVWQSEATLFAASGIAELLGAPDKPPLVPNANYAAHSIGYAAFTAICALHSGQRLGGASDVATLRGEHVLTWVNWKAAESGSRGISPKREGDQAEWPVLPCKDGHVALIFTEREWDRVVLMVADPKLHDANFSTFEKRAQNRTAYVEILQGWAEAKTLSELEALFLEFGVPGAPVSSPDMLCADPLLKHQHVFETTSNETDAPCALPNVPHTIIAQEQSLNGSARKLQRREGSALPLCGLRVLDLGIITAGAGVSAMLADLGAEVLKVESKTYPDPFRMWAGAETTDSGVFKFNNRNKFGIDIDLKKSEGIAQFLELAKSADIVLENFRRGVLDRLGLTFDALRAANPSILLASISGMGHDGEGSQLPTFGSTLEANSGFSYLTRYSDGAPQVSGRNLNYPDQIVCLYAAGAISAAAVDCRLGGIARHMDVSQRSCAIYQIGDKLGKPNPLDLDQFFRCSDGEYLAVSFTEPNELSHRLGIDLHDNNALQEWIGNRPSEAVIQAFDTPTSAAVRSATGIEIYRNADMWENKVFTQSPSGEMVKGFAFQLRAGALAIGLNAPRVGEHNYLFLNKNEDQNGS